MYQSAGGTVPYFKHGMSWEEEARRGGVQVWVSVGIVLSVAPKSTHGV